MRKCSAFKAGGTRVIVIGGPSPRRRKPLSRHEAILWARAIRRSYIGLLIGLAVGLLLLAVLLLSGSD